jgi:hypothetical protein
MRHASTRISRWQIHCGRDAGSLVVSVSCASPNRAEPTAPAESLGSVYEYE